jgi:hypothetical protein
MTQTIDHDTDRWNPRDEDNLGNMWFHLNRDYGRSDSDVGRRSARISAHQP